MNNAVLDHLQQIENGSCKECIIRVLHDYDKKKFFLRLNYEGNARSITEAYSK